MVYRFFIHAKLQIKEGPRRPGGLEIGYLRTPPLYRWWSLRSFICQTKMTRAQGWGWALFPETTPRYYRDAYGYNREMRHGPRG